jgi:predicted RNA-binding protein with RPS1 domain
VGDPLKVLVLSVDATRARIALSTKKLEQEPGDFLRLSREEFSERAEAQAAAFRDKIDAPPVDGETLESVGTAATVSLKHQYFSLAGKASGEQRHFKL